MYGYNYSGRDEEVASAPRCGHCHGTGMKAGSVCAPCAGTGFAGGREP